jgi:hypothetical protein
LNAIPCNTLQQDFRNNLKAPLESIYFSLKSLLKNLQSSNQDLLRSVRSDCHFSNIGLIHTQLRLFVNERSLTYVRSCEGGGLYKSSSIKKWVASIENIAALFVFAVKGCEIINNKHNSLFDFNLFNEIVKSLNYFKTYRFLLEFIRDRSLGF